MNRTIKFQLSNIKKSYLFAALFSYGAVALFYLIALLFDQGALSDLSAQPLWLSALFLVAGPFTFLPILYAVWDGLMFFDTALRFGISRKSYFITQVIIYILITLLTVFAGGLTETAWTGTASTYFAVIGENYFSIVNIASEFILTIALAIGVLAVYRFKVKALIPLIFVGPALGIIIGASFSISENTFIVDRIIAIAEFVINNQELSAVFLIAVLIGIYYLFISKTEVQD